MAQDAASTEPLMHESDHEEAEQDDFQTAPALPVTRAAQDQGHGAVDLAPSLFVWRLTLAAGVAGLLFGYDTGVISSTLVSIHDSLSERALTTLDKSLITSSTSFFALLASPCTGFLADATGRKPVILLASLLFVAGALLQAVSTTVGGMIVGRSVVGLAIGSASFVVPLYISELSPSSWRGRLVTVSALFITGGQIVAYVVGWGFSAREGGWRWMCGLGAVPAFAQLAMLIGMPETPRWLVKAQRATQAKLILGKVYGEGRGRDATVASVLKGIEDEIRDEAAAVSKGAASATPIVDLFTTNGNRRALTIACMLQAAQQLCGFNSLMYFSATIFALVGFTSPTLASLTIAVTNFVFTVIAFFIIDKTGRRRMLLMSIPFMIVGLGMCALAFSFLDLHPDRADDSVQATASRLALAANEPKELVRAKPTTPWAPMLLVISLILYVSSYALGLGNVPWQQSELFPLRVRSIGSSLSTATNWSSNTLVGLTFLPMMEALSPQVTFLLYAVVCIVAWVAVWRCYPETAGLSLEEVGTLLAQGWGVQRRPR